MIDPKDAVEIAKAAGNVQFAINLLHQKLTHLLKTTNPNIKKLDFNQSLDFLQKNRDQFFTDPEIRKSSHSKLQRAKNVRNKYSHQDFDPHQFQHDIECLASIAALINCTELEMKIRDLAKTDRDLKTDLEIGTTTGDWQQLKEEGNEHYKNSQWTEAMNCYTKAIRINSKVAHLYSNRALCELKLSKFELAREDAEDAIELDSSQVKFHRILSEALLGLSLLEDAKEVCQRGLKIDPRDETLVLRLRDCQAMSVDQQVKQHPEQGKVIPEDKHVAKNILNNFFKCNDEVSADDILQLDKLTAKNSFQIAEAHKILAKSKGSISEEQKAFRIYEITAKRGSAEGLYNLGLIYKNGMAGLARDFKKANNLFHEAASKKPYVGLNKQIMANPGVAEAENAIAISYRDGFGVDQDDKLAFQWFLKSAQHGCASAQNNLGNFLSSGTGCSQNLESARQWFQKSADLGQSEAQFNLAYMLMNGKGGPVDCKKAESLFRAAADQGLPQALIALQKLLRSGSSGVKAMDDSQKIVIDKAEKGDKNAYFLLGCNYLHGVGGFEKDLVQAEDNLRKASKLGHPDSDFILASVLLEQAKNEEGFYFMKNAAEKGQNHEAQKELAFLLALGHGCERDPLQARRWLMRASKHKDINVNDTMLMLEKVVEFETLEQLSAGELTVKERIERHMTKMAEKMPECSNFIKFVNEGLKNPPTPWSDTSSMETTFPEMLRRAAEGSKTAVRFLEGMKCFDDALICLQAGSISTAFSLYNSARKIWDLLPVSEFDKSAFIKAASKALEENPDDDEALFVLLRCKATAKSFDIHQQVSLARRLVEINPAKAEYHHVLGCLYGFQGDYISSQLNIENALKIEFNPEWLYDKASSMRLREGHDPLEVISVYQEYIELSEEDSRKIPEAYYCIGFEYALMLKDFKRAAEFQKRAMRAENPPVRLPCFGPVEDDFPPKFTLNMILSMEQKYGKSKIQGLPKEEPQCGHCNKAGAPSRCIRCKTVSYCNRECQKQDWKRHKKDCHPHGEKN